jgi:hypothetical protein
MGNLLSEVRGDDLLTIERITIPIEGIYVGIRGLPIGHAYIIETDNGIAEIAGCTDLNKKMAKVKEGCTVRISNAGKITTKGGREMFRSKVEASLPVLDAFSM